MVRYLVFGDLHLGYDGGSYTAREEGSYLRYDRLDLPTDRVDGVLLVGDVFDGDAGADRDAARAFFEYLDALPVPVAVVPGNHDPAPLYDGLLDGLDVAFAHERRLGPADGFDLPVVGWGCPDFLHREGVPSLSPEVPYADLLGVPAVSSSPDEARRARDAAERVLDAGDRDRFATAADRAADVYDALSELLAGGPSLALTHLPPFGTELDTDNAYADGDVRHDGSLGLALALRENPPVASLSGHHHNRGFPEGQHGGGTPPLLNVGYRTLVRVEVDAERDRVGWQARSLLDRFDADPP
ncbi:MAG: metallophosphoesterase [Halobacteriaceae archaeon]